MKIVEYRDIQRFLDNATVHPDSYREKSERSQFKQALNIKSVFNSNQDPIKTALIFILQQRHKFKIAVFILFKFPGFLAGDFGHDLCPTFANRNNELPPYF